MAETPLIQSLREKTGQLIEDNRRLRTENRRLEEQRDKLKADGRASAARIAELEKRVNVLELRDAVSGDSEDAKVARARINRLMREVDKCIALLNR